MKSPYDVVRDFEQALCEYTGATYAVTVNSCTMALLLAVKWYIELPMEVSIPKHTYVSVPMSIVHAGGTPVFRDENWHGFYRLQPLPVYDCARMLTSGMYLPGSMQCLSFHTTKILGDTQGGAILLDDPDAYAWLKRMRFDGRTEGWTPRYQAEHNEFTEIGYHCYLSPDVAARLLWKLQSLSKHNEPLPCDDYPDLSKLEIFK
jgi:dTDP-4-amino-4,6-dideoxygalactose transaminase